jgi:penicillin-binding protein 1A
MPETVRIDRPVTIKGWSPENYSRKYLGPVTLQTALSLSLNTVSAQLTDEVGPKAVATTARRLGIASPLMATPSIALGTSDVTLLEMTGAFAPFANGGTGVIPHVVKRIATTDGKVLYERAGDGPGRVVDPAYVGMMNSMLRATVETGTGRKAEIPNWPVAGKTGTSQDFRDAWFIGYTGTMVAGAWFGNDDGKPTKKASGSNLPAIAWQRFMTGALAGLAVADLPGNYQFRNPQNVAGPAMVEDTGVAAPGARSGDPIGQLADAPEDGPVPPADIGPQSPADVGPAAQPPKKKGFFRRLFGG